MRRREVVNTQRSTFCSDTVLLVVLSHSPTKLKISLDKARALFRNVAAFSQAIFHAGLATSTAIANKAQQV